MGIMAIPIPIQVVSHSLPFPFPILLPIPITMGIPWDSHSHWESHSHGHLYSGVQSYECVIHEGHENEILMSLRQNCRCQTGERRHSGMSRERIKDRPRIRWIPGTLPTGLVLGSTKLHDWWRRTKLSGYWIVRVHHVATLTDLTWPDLTQYMILLLSLLRQN